MCLDATMALGTATNPGGGYRTVELAALESTEALLVPAGGDKLLRRRWRTNWVLWPLHLPPSVQHLRWPMGMRAASCRPRATASVSALLDVAAALVW